MKALKAIKRFADWLLVKERLHENVKNNPHVSVGEVWWVSFGENVGSEIGGKGTLFTRPGLVFKKLTRNKFLAIPTTSQTRSGSWYVEIQYGDNSGTVILSEVRIVDTRRLTSRLGRINARDLKRVREAFRALYLS